MYRIYHSISYGKFCMGTIAKVFPSTQRLRKIRRNSYWQQRFFHPLLFQDDLYGIAYNRFVGESNHRRKQIFSYNNGFDFLALKRFMKKLRRSNIPWAGSDECIDEFQIVQEIAIIIFNLTLSLRSEPSIEEMNEWNSYQSIHSVFPFLGDNICNSNNCLDFTIPYFVHPERLIRIFRRRIPDISFLHFLRFSLHRNPIVPNPPIILRENQFYRFLWNFYIYEFEYSLIHIWKRLYQFKSTPFWLFFDRICFVLKIGYILEQSDSFIDKNVVGRNHSIHYVRYGNNFIININADMELLVKNWNKFITTFMGKHFHCWFQPYRLSVNNVSKNFIPFLGYIICTESKSVIIRIQLMNYSIDTNSVIKKFCSAIPIVPLIGLLTKERFCDTSGRPTCKLPRTTLADNEIIERFNRIMRSISCYYSGCFERKGLYQLQYILRFSCAKTLACKHKSTIRTVWKKYGSNFAKNYSREVELISSNSWRIDFHERKFWYLNITRTNYFSNSLQKLKNVRNSK